MFLFCKKSRLYELSWETDYLFSASVWTKEWRSGEKSLFLPL